MSFDIETSMEMDECELWKEENDWWDSEDLEEFSSSSSPSISTQDSLELVDSLELDIVVDQLTSEILHLAKEQVELEAQVELEVQLEQDGVFWGTPSVDGSIGEAEGQLPGSCMPVEFAGGEAPVRIVIIEEEHHEVRTKSWWRRQANRMWKAIKSVANFCLRCQGLKRGQRSEQVLPV